MPPNNLQNLTAKINALSRQPNLVSPHCQHVPFHVPMFLLCLLLGLGLSYLSTHPAPLSTAIALSSTILLFLCLVYSIPPHSSLSFFIRLTFNISIFLFCVSISSNQHSLDLALRYLTPTTFVNSILVYLTLNATTLVYSLALREVIRCSHHALALKVMLRDYPTLFTPAEKHLLTQVNTQHLQTIQLLAEYRVQSQKD